MKMNFKGLALVLITFLATSYFGIRFYQQQQLPKVPTEAQPAKNPVFLIPGTNATNKRFNSFTESLMEEQVTSNAVLKIQVKKDGKIHYLNQLKKNSERPFIVVGFEDNTEKAVDIEAKWFQNVVLDVKKKYPFSTFDAVGHSNGGLVLATYLENYQTTSKPQMNRLITIATPFNDTKAEYNDNNLAFTEVKKASHLLTNFIEKQTQLPSSLKVLALAGNQEKNETHSDGVVPVQSAFASRLFIKKQVASYQESIITGKQTGHSDLLDNSKVQNQVKAFIYQDEN